MGRERMPRAENQVFTMFHGLGSVRLLLCFHGYLGHTDVALYLVPPGCCRVLNSQFVISDALGLDHEVKTEVLAPAHGLAKRCSQIIWGGVVSCHIFKGLLVYFQARRDGKTSWPDLGQTGTVQLRSTELVQDCALLSRQSFLQFSPKQRCL